MARSANSKAAVAGNSTVTAADIARSDASLQGFVRSGRDRRLSLAQTDAMAARDAAKLRRKVIIWAVIFIPLFFFSLCIGGNQGIYHGAPTEYYNFSPLEVIEGIGLRLHDLVALTPFVTAYDNQWLVDNHIVYFFLPYKLGVIVITCVCALLLSLSGMLYQNVFKNPIAGPGMLGVGSGVSLGMTLLVFLFGNGAAGMLTERYLYCYGFGVAILVFVILAGKKVSGKGRAFDIVSMLLIGSMISQLLGVIVSYITLFVMDPSTYSFYVELNQMLSVDTSLISMICLAVVCAVTMVPLWLLRYRWNALSFTDEEARLMSVDSTKLRAAALIIGAVMILAAQIHIGAVAMVSLIVPFLSRSWFGCDSVKQTIGNVCISTVLLLVCRDLVDLVPFVGMGLGIGVAVTILVLPLYFLIMSRHMRGWE